MGSKTAFAIYIWYFKVCANKQFFGVWDFKHIEIFAICGPQFFVKGGTEMTYVVMGDFCHFAQSRVFPKMYMHIKLFEKSRKSLKR